MGKMAFMVLAGGIIVAQLLLNLSGVSLTEELFDSGSSNYNSGGYTNSGGYSGGYHK